MGKVIQFTQVTLARPIERSLRSGQLDDYLLALIIKAISANESVIERDLQVIKSIARSTETPELRDQLLRQMKAIQDRLLLVALDLLNAKCLMQNTIEAAREGPITR
jgi:hypothetical protein